jgi:hypothetical protein
MMYKANINERRVERHCSILPRATQTTGSEQRARGDSNEGKVDTGVLTTDGWHCKLFNSQHAGGPCKLQLEE